MLSREDNELLCRVGPGTPMGALMRQYWIPALMSSELPERRRPARARPAPRREPRSPSASPPARSASSRTTARTAAPRSSSAATRKRACAASITAGSSTARAPASTCRTSRRRATSSRRSARRAYPCVERNDIVWTYMGPRRRRRPCPTSSPTCWPGASTPSRRSCASATGSRRSRATSTRATWASCTWAPSSRRTRSRARSTTTLVKDRAPRIRGGRHRVRHVLRRLPSGRGGHVLLAHRPLPVPVLHDDPHRHSRHAGPRPRLGADRRRARDVLEHGGPAFADGYRCHRRGAGLTHGGRPVGAAGARPGGFEFLPDTTDWLGKFRLTQHKDNDYLIDREAQRRESFTGIAGIHQQDQAVTESMGPIYDRTQEHLGTSDAMVIRTRRRVINAARALRDERRRSAWRRRPEGVPPPLGRRDPAARGRLARGDEGSAPGVRRWKADGDGDPGHQRGRVANEALLNRTSKCTLGSTEGGTPMPKVPEIIPITDLRQDAATALKRVRATKQPLVITQRGRAAAVMISVEAYERAEHERQILLILARGEREIRTEKGHDLDEVMGEADRLLADT